MADAISSLQWQVTETVGLITIYEDLYHFHDCCPLMMIGDNNSCSVSAPPAKPAEQTTSHPPCVLPFYTTVHWCSLWIALYLPSLHFDTRIFAQSTMFCWLHKGATDSALELVHKHTLQKLPRRNHGFGQLGLLSTLYLLFCF